MKYVFDIKYEESFTATSKAREDVNKILTKAGYKVIYFSMKKTNSSFDLYKNIKYIYNQMKVAFNNIPSKSTIVFQYPFDSLNYKFSKYIKKQKFEKKLKTIALIHDLNLIRTSSRVGRFYYKHIIKENKFLNNFDKVICHNEKMKVYLLENGVSNKKLVKLKLFDYLIEGKSSNKGTNDFKKLVIAGNLSSVKAGYVYDLCNVDINNYIVELYGINYTGKTSNNIVYKGSFKSDDPSCINGGFGLIWDGSSCDRCDGNFGEYLKYNNPHKFSLCMACGIPVIVWKESALADMVIKNKIGYVVSNLYEIDSIFEDLTINEYLNLKKNVEKIQNKVLNGKFLLDAIEKCR